MLNLLFLVHNVEACYHFAMDQHNKRTCSEVISVDEASSLSPFGIVGSDVHCHLMIHLDLVSFTNIVVCNGYLYHDYFLFSEVFEVDLPRIVVLNEEVSQAIYSFFSFGLHDSKLPSHSQ